MSKHELAKNKICRWCCSKVGQIILKNNSLISTNLGKQFSVFFEAIDPMEDNGPNVLCNSCKMFLVNREICQDTSRKISIRFSWPIIRNTRLNNCNTVNPCAMGIESSRFGPINRAPLPILQEKPGRPLINSPQKVLKLCSKCLCTIKPGVSHNCSKDSLIDNSQLLLAQKHSIELVVSSEILRRFSSEESEGSSLLISRPTGGHPIHILQVNSDQQPLYIIPKLDFSDISQIKCTGGAMSNRQLKAVTKVIRGAGVIPSITLGHKYQAIDSIRVIYR